MNYYEKHIGDYLKDTAHLSLLEHGVYSRLLDIYYTREEPIPEAQAMRLVGARTDEERSAVRDVLTEFFTRDGDVHRHGRCDREISRYQEKQRKASASANARWNKTDAQTEGNADAMRTHSEGNAPSNQTPVTSNTPPVVPQGDRKTPDIPCPYSRIIDLYHDVLPELPRAKLLTAARQRVIRKRWGWVLSSTKSDGTRRATDADGGLQWLRGYFEHAAKNDFLMGRSPRSAEHANWQCDIDYLMTDKGLQQVVEKTRDAA